MANLTGEPLYVISHFSLATLKMDPSTVTADSVVVTCLVVAVFEMPLYRFFFFNSRNMKELFYPFYKQLVPSFPVSFLVNLLFAQSDICLLRL